MPLMTEATLRKSIKFEAGRYVPTSVEDSFIEFEIIGPHDDGQMDVLMVAAPKDIVSSRVAACEAAGLEVDSVDVEVFAAYRSLIEADADSPWFDKTIGLVDIGASKTNICVIRNGVFTMTRSIPQGGDVLTDALKSYFKLSDEEAESGKSQLDLNDLIHDEKPQENPPLRVIQPHVDDLVREIRRSLNYYQSQQTEENQSKQIDALVITGGGAKLGGLDTYAGAKLKLPTQRLGIRHSTSFAHAGHEETGEGTELSVVCGLAMRSHREARRSAA
jgi:type IV pilus assembly protein PilM